MITIRQPLSFNHIGQKSNQEDSLFPANATPKSRVFVLCDGMGGHESGEVASSVAANTIGNALSDALQNGIKADGRIWRQAISDAYTALDQAFKHTETARRPGTTLAAVVLNKRTFTCGHIGDSRIYHIRPSLYSAEYPTDAILFQSQDHSLVSQLVKSGEITPEQARNHPKRNIITRAIQPGLTKQYPADISLRGNLEAGDYIFICSDGVLEQLTDTRLCEILANRDLVSDNERIRAIERICQDRTHDNYSAWLIPIQSIPAPKAPRKPRRHPSPTAVMALCGIIITIAAAGIVSWYLKRPSTGNNIEANKTGTNTDTALTDSIVILHPDKTTLDSTYVQPPPLKPESGTSPANAEPTTHKPYTQNATNNGPNGEAKRAEDTHPDQGQQPTSQSLIPPDDLTLDTPQLKQAPASSENSVPPKPQRPPTTSTKP